MLVYIVMVELDEVLKEVEVESDVDSHIALNESLDYSGDFMAKSWYEILITDDSV